MISLYLRPDKTQILKGRLKKDQTLSITHATEIQSYYSLLTNKSTNEIVENNLIYDAPLEDLTSLFQELKKVVPTSYEEVYIILPDMLFTSINCGDVLSEDEYMEFVRGQTGKEDESVYYSFPIISSPGGMVKKTFFAIDRTIIDALAEAAHMENISLTSIEPASIAFFRSCDKWQEERFLLEMFEEEATIVAYSPVAGMFSLNTPSLRKKNLEDLNKANDEFEKIFAIQDFTAGKIFPSINVNIPFTVLVEKSDPLLHLNAFSERLAEQEILPDYVDADISQEYQQEWLIPIGALLQNKEFQNEYMPTFLKIKSANVLPEQIKMNAKFRQWKHLAKKYSRILIVFLAAMAFFETGGILYFSSISINPKLQADYDTAQKNIKDVDAEIKLLAAAKKEHEYPVEAFHQLLSDRPDACGFSSISIGNNGTNAQDSNEKWIHVTAVSSDPLVLQSFASTLSTDEMFTHVALNKMDTDSSGIKIADLTIGKGKI